MYMCPDLFLEEVPHLPCGSIGWSLTGGSTVIRRLESVAKLSLQVTDKKLHNGKYPGSQTPTGSDEREGIGRSEKT